MRSRADHLLHAPAETWHSAPIESWHSLLDDPPEEPAPEPEPPREEQRDILDELVPPEKPTVETAEPIGFAHNGFHVDEEKRFQPLPPPAETRPPRHERSARHHRPTEQPEKRQFWFESNGRHSRDDPDDASSYGRHSMPGRD